MDAVKIYEEAARKVGRGEINLMEFWKLIRPLRDVEAVVRCRDCRWWHDWSGECYAKEAQGFGHLWEADDYCSFGERKDGDHEQTKKPE